MGRKLLEFPQDGDWWAPETPEKKVHGTLKIHGPSSSFRLSVRSGHEKLTRSLSEQGIAEKPEQQVILGKLDTGKSVSLVHVLGSAGRDYLSEYAFVGNSHFESVGTLKFQSMTVRFSHLEPWLVHFQELIHIRSRQHYDPDSVVSDPNNYLEISLPEVETINYRVELLQTTFGFEISFYSNSDQWKVDLQCHAQINITPDAPQAFSWYQHVIQQLSRLLALFVGQAVEPTRIEYKGEHQLPGSKKILQGDVLEPGFRQEQLTPSRSQVITHFYDVRENLGDILSSWFDRTETQKDADDLLISTFFKPDSYITHHFLSLVQSLEAYHRGNYSGKAMDEADFEALKHVMLEAIPDGLDPDYLKSFTKKIELANEIPLRKRFREIFKDIDPDLAEKIIGSNKRLQSLAIKLADTRNFYSHYTDELRKKAYKGGALVDVSEQVKWIAIAALHNRIGAKTTGIHRYLERHPHLEDIFKFGRQNS